MKIIAALLALLVGVSTTSVRSYADEGTVDFLGKKKHKKQTDSVSTKKTKASAKQADGSAAENKLMIVIQNDCVTLEFPEATGELISCTEKLPIHYIYRDCDSRKLKEAGDTEGVVDCSDERRINLSFNISKGPIETVLRVIRENKGKAGSAANYQVESARFLNNKLAEALPSPDVKNDSTPLPDESPIKFKFSGFASVEHERTSFFGFDAGNTSTSQGAQPNFSQGAGQTSQSNTNFFSNLNFELSRDRTSLVSIFEIGEIYFGDTASGGGQGARVGNIFEVRNLYLSHRLTEQFALSGGVITTNSDPRGFIFSDHIAGVQLKYSTDVLNGMLWYGNAFQNRAGAAKNRDHYLGFNASYVWSPEFTSSLFGISRFKALDQFAVDPTGAGTFSVSTSNSKYYWAGTNIAATLGNFKLDLTGIGNWVRLKGADISSNSFAYLADAKMSYLWSAPQVTFTLEGLATPGATGVTESTTNRQIASKRKNFVSPVGTGYLMTIATSDGLDDSVGTPKQSIIGNLGMDEGLRVAVFSTAVGLTKKLTLLTRWGYLMTAAASSATGSKQLGHEGDVQAVYQVTPSTTLQLDYAKFFPGKFYSERNPADLAAAKMKFVF